MKIPKSFTLAGMAWSVKETGLINEFGFCNFDEQEISIAENMSDQLKERSYCHELVHSICYSMGWTEHDEKFVDGFAAYLHQYFKQFHK